MYLCHNNGIIATVNLDANFGVTSINCFTSFFIKCKIDEISRGYFRLCTIISKTILHLSYNTMYSKKFKTTNENNQITHVPVNYS